MTKQLHHYSKGLFLCHVCCLKQISSGNPLGRKKREKKKPQNPKQEPNPRILSDDLSKVNIYEVVTAWEESMLFQYHKQCHCFHSVFWSFTPLNQQITSQRQLMCQGLVQTMCLIFTAWKGQSSRSRTIFSI